MPRFGRRGFNQTLIASGLVAATPAVAAEKVLRVAMTAADIPLTTGQPNQGIRFMGITAYDALVNWDLSQPDVAASIRPGLAESWGVDPEKTTRWTFRPRRGVTFHDGSACTADAVIWNLDKLIRREAPQYDQGQATQAATWSSVLARYQAIDPFTVVLETKVPDANLPFEMSSIFMSRPKRWEDVGRDLRKFAAWPSGTGPWMVTKVVPRQRVEFVHHAGY